MSLRDETAEDYLHCDLAPAFGKLNSTSLQALDDELKIMIAGLTKQIGKIPSKNRTWESVVELCIQSDFLQGFGDEIARSDKLIKSSTSDFRTNGSPNDIIVKEVQQKALFSDSLLTGI